MGPLRVESPQKEAKECAIHALLRVAATRSPAVHPTSRGEKSGSGAGRQLF
jgi:hypothetical protein